MNVFFWEIARHYGVQVGDRHVQVLDPMQDPWLNHFQWPMYVVGK